MQYLINLLMAVDQFLSTVLGGHPDDTISQRLGRAHLSGNRGLTDKVRSIIDFVCELFGEKDHCVNSLFGRTNAKELWNWGGSRRQIKVDDNLDS